MEKQIDTTETHHVESGYEGLPPPQSWDAIINSFSDKEARALKRKIDLRLVVTLGCMYCVSLMDRNNLGNAAITGMSGDLNLIGNRYNLVVLLFFITYVIVQPIAVALLRKIGPQIFLPTIVLLWGMLLIGFGFVHYWYQLLPLRIVLGMLEGGFLPGCVYLMSTWYVRHELQIRNSLFYVLGIMASAFSGILSYGFAQMNGLGSGPAWMGLHYGPTKANPHAPKGIENGLAGWRWIFIWQGILTCLVALVGYVFTVDFPENTMKHRHLVRFLSQREVDYMIARVEKDREDVALEKFQLKAYLKNALDLKLWGFGFLAMLSVGPAYAIALFLPIILKEDMGFNTAQALCLTAPPQILAVIVTMVSAHYSDKWKLRFPFVMLNGSLALIGCGLLGWTRSIAARYFGAFLVASGVNANVPANLTWQANNVRGQWKRAFVSALNVSLAGCGGIMGGTVFRGQDSPGYLPVIITCMICGCLIITITIAMTLYFARSNRRADEGKIVIEGLEGFRYTL
ncbi:uncharacterized protein Z520_05888 [Fonsecaea multimorphosa CBS 102226]|uniref:Major facilitator superfamily (MFS) profile domain-containing protein n=1 Tax=Fonsecaea multimorphosa CBS 102226 TaxID=1442371 RepID=A0A0D2JYH0_9EURO|nr:uncharacterized protein Z520_05888 [Fonsecaea multimorphosa CBS 102226]KIX98587.1 hypothetical protein Z520_05888 [Fonsecaea multimorphosa CBS 102226]OAL24777.1 hypothetical protein AYO22_05566 [Fonsecaea multimorphosa]